MTSSRAGILNEIIFSPKKAFSEIGSNGKKFFPIAFVILLITSISTPVAIYFLEASNVQFYVGEQLPLGFVSIFFEIEVGFFLSVFSAAAIYEIGKRFGGKGTFKGVFSSICYSSLPITIIFGLIALTMILFTYNSGSEAFLGDEFFLGFSIFAVSLMTIMFASLVWSIILGIMALMKSHELSFGKSMGVLILVAIITILISILIP